MIQHFCTYFDVNYLARGLALHASLRIHSPHSRLWVLCMDSACFEALQQYRLEGVHPIRLADFEAGDHRLLEAKSNRSRVEYYFTCTPSLLLYLMRSVPDVQTLTYLDADLFFFSDPAPLFDEMGDQSIAIIGHRFPPALRFKEQFGIYNVGWLSFRRDQNAEACLEWWRTKCIEWCHDYADKGRFADQKYLDVWPEKFQKVVVLQHLGANLAPWNLANYTLRLEKEKVFVGRHPLIFFHFHGLRHCGGDSYDFNLAPYGVRPSEILIRQVFDPYIKVLIAAFQISAPWQNGISWATSIRKQFAQTHRQYECPTEGVGIKRRSSAWDMPSESTDRRQSCLPIQLASLRETTNRSWSNEIVQRLSRIRGELTELWRNASERELPQLYAGRAGRLQREIMTGPLKDHPLSHEDRQKAAGLIESIVRRTAGASDVRFLLAAMLYCQPHELPGACAIPNLPEWLQLDYLRFLLQLPHSFHCEGGVEAWCDHLEKIMAFIDTGLRRYPHSRV